jgi:hypothetical protein
VQYALGIAHFDLAQQHRNAQKQSEAQDAFEAAHRYFGRAARSEQGVLQRAALYNGANALAFAGFVAAAHNPAHAIERLESAIETYERLLAAAPEHAAAAQNLNHVRYKLKLMLRKHQDEQKDGNPGKDNAGSGNKDQKSGSAKSNGEDQGERQRQDEESSQRRSGTGEPKGEKTLGGDQEEKVPGNETDPQKIDNRKSPENETRDERTPQSSPLSTLHVAREQEVRGGASERLDHKSVEALLQSLEEVDRLEQRRRFSGPRQTQVPREWW